MSIVFKCKMCGGDLDIKDGENITQCPYCGSYQTISNTEFLETSRLYTVLNAADNVSRSFYASASLTAKLDLWAGLNWAPINFSPEITLSKQGILGAVPDMKDITWELDKKAPWRGTLTVPLDRSLLFPKQVRYYRTERKRAINGE